MVKGSYVIRFVANQQDCNKEQVEVAWKMIQEFATEILEGGAKPPILNERTSQRFSYTRRVSKKFYERHSSL